MVESVNKTMEIEFELRVTDLSRGGAGVSRDPSGRVVFIPFSAPGDRLKVRILEQNKRFARGEILEIIEPSAFRQKPRCPVFGQCGGCQWQHLTYELQWQTKVKGVLQALKRVKVELPENLEQIPAERIWEYRNRIQLRGEGSQMGYYRSQSRDLVPVNRCDIARPEINESWEDTRTQASKLKAPYKVEVEVTSEGKIQRSWNAPHSAGGFRQVHDEQNEKLRNWILEAMTGTDILYDLFGGAGNLCLPLVKKMKEIHCIDLSSPKSPPAGVPNTVHFHPTSVLSWLSKRVRNLSFSSSSGSASAILDPPREGLGESFSEAANSLEQLHVNELVLVGCDPDSWARDLSRWFAKGWRIRRFMVIDLFPQTAHVESVALLRRDWE